MKILLISPFFYPVKGGMEEHVFQIAKELVKRNHKVTVFTSNLSRKGKINIKEEMFNKIKIKRFNSIIKIGDFASFSPGIFTEIKKETPDIIHIHGYRHPSNLIPLITKKPCIITLHWPNYPKGLRTKINDLIIPFFDKTIGKFLLKKFKTLIAINPMEVEWIKNNLKINKVSLLPNAIPKEYLKKRDPRIFRKKYNLKKELTILSLSRIHKSKGLDLTVKVAKFFPNVKFLIAGPDAGYLKELKYLARGLNNIKFLGEIPENIKLNAFSASDIFLFPSHYEGFGIVVLEAFSQKSAVISSDSGALPYVINNSGLLFKDNNLKDLRTKLNLLIKNKNLRNKYSKLGYKRVKEFTWDRVVDNLESEYKRIK